jgi:uncharacterized delta-60 repeat protein
MHISSLVPTKWNAIRRNARVLVGAAIAITVVCALPASASASPGQIDATFGNLHNGTVVADQGANYVIQKMLRQPDGKIVTIATLTDDQGTNFLVVSRYLASGRLDSSFAGNGVYVENEGGTRSISDGVLQPDGKIVLAGDIGLVVGDSGQPADFFVERLRADGTLDPTFVVAHGRTNFPGNHNDLAVGVALGVGGTIVVAGTSNSDIAIARYRSTGALDPSFSGDGLATHDFGGGGFSHATDVAVLPNNRIIVSGFETLANATSRTLIARFNTNGTLDASFGTGGRVAPGTKMKVANALILQGTKPVVAGAVDAITSSIARYNANGTLDPTFGSGGETIPRAGDVTEIRALDTDASGRLLAIGSSGLSQHLPDARPFAALFRFSANGALDPTFGCGGFTLTDVLGNGAGTNYVDSAASAVAATGNDVVIGGSALMTTGHIDSFLARFHGSGASTPGYALLRGDGGTSAFGGAPACGSMAGLHLNQPVVGTAFDPVAPGNWTVASDGGIFSFGAAHFFGSTGGMHLNRPIVGMAATKTGKGYWLVATDGGIFAFGDARFHGSMGGTHINQPIVGMAPTKTGNGYWLVARDGGIFAFGDARFSGSMGGSRLNQPVVGMAADPDGTGYWLVASDGGIFSFAAKFSGSTGAIRLNQPVVGMAADPDGTGYWMGARDGGIFAFAATFSGSTGATPFPVGDTRSTIGIAAAP